MNTKTLNSKTEGGFTLVELAIVMIIIGLLIGGILKGQELIANAEVSAGVSQLKGVDSAVSTFRDAYNAFPGDITNAANRIKNCNQAPCNIVPASSNGHLERAPGVAVNIADDGAAFWAQLSASDIMGGVTPSAAAVALGESHPEFQIDGGLRVGYTATGAGADMPAITAAAAPTAGHYVAVGDLGGAIGATNVLTPLEASRLDTKIDDGAPNTGSVLGAGVANGCTDDGTPTGIYSTASSQTDCSLYMRIQG